MNIHTKLPLRTSKATSFSDEKRLNRHNTGQFFYTLQVVYSREQLELQSIWNID